MSRAGESSVGEGTVYRNHSAAKTEELQLYDLFELFLIGGRNFQHRKKGFLRNIHLADALHAAFALFLLFEELAFARDVAAVSFGQHVLADRCHRFTRNDAAANGRLNRHLE